ncbi:hypothetical protein K523DRAFT_20670 [Schizophyllum commune Tattone D]|nr:hypothetical protein K523DRAFT_20670 [Schizophyllum commune Tattone D]
MAKAQSAPVHGPLPRGVSAFELSVSYRPRQASFCPQVSYSACTLNSLRPRCMSRSSREYETRSRTLSHASRRACVHTTLGVIGGPPTYVERPSRIPRGSPPSMYSTQWPAPSPPQRRPRSESTRAYRIGQLRFVAVIVIDFVADIGDTDVAQRFIAGVLKW